MIAFKKKALIKILGERVNDGKLKKVLENVWNLIINKFYLCDLCFLNQS